MGQVLSRFLFCGLLAALLLSMVSPALARGKTNYNGRELDGIMDSARRSAGSNRVQTKKGSVPIVAEIKGGSGGKYQALINGTWQISEYSVQTLTYPAAVMHYGDRFELAFLGQPLPAHLAEGIRNHKGMVKAENAWKKKYKDVQVNVGVEENRVFLTAVYSYPTGATKGDLVNRLSYLFKASSGVLVWSYHAEDDVEKEYLKGIKGKITYLPQEGLVNLFDDGLGDYFDEDGDAAEGDWFFNYEDRPIYIANHGDKVVFNYHYGLPDKVKDANKQKVLDGTVAYVAKKKLKHASSQEMTWFDEDAKDTLWLTITFNLDGNLKGDDLRKAYFDYYKNYVKNLEKEIEKIVKKN